MRRELHDPSTKDGKFQVPHVLSAACSDSGARAGIQAELKACAVRGVYCSTVITALTAQTTVGVRGVNIVDEEFVGEQLKLVLSGMFPDVAKTGMLPSPGIIKILSQSLREFRVIEKRILTSMTFWKQLKHAEKYAAAGVPFLINDRINIALACDADGVHIGHSDMPSRVARTLLGPHKDIGVSCKTPRQAEKAWIDGADYIGCGKENNITVGLDDLTSVCLASESERS